jgi:hypothetical protein
MGEGKFGGRPPSELRVWASLIVIGSPTSEDDASLGQGRKQRFIQQFIP